MAWQQDPAAQRQMAAEQWQEQQAAMNQALRTILIIQGFWNEDGPPGEAPVVVDTARPTSVS